MIKIVLDSSGDILSKDLTECIDKEFEGFAVEGVPLSIYTDKDSFLDDRDLNVGEMLSVLEKHKGRSYTSCPGTGSWLDAFEGGDEIYVITITSGLSGTYNAARVAMDMFVADHPEVKMEVFDSLSTGPEMKLMAEKIVELKRQGKAFEEVCKEVYEYRDKARLFFVLQSVHNLAENGRVNKLVATAVGALGISIVGTASEQGTIEPVAKCRGEKKIVATVLDQIKKVGYKGGKVRIGHVQNKELAAKVVEAITAEFGEVDAQYYQSTGLCSFYAERGGILVGVECE